MAETEAEGAPAAALAELGGRLVALGLIDAAEWRGAETAGALAAALAWLQRQPGRWRTLDGRVFPVLTPYQAEQIRQGQAERLRLGHYILLDRLGAGGTGEVYLAFHPVLRRLEAVKTIHLCEP